MTKWGYFIIYMEKISTENVIKIYIKKDYIRLKP